MCLYHRYRRDKYGDAHAEGVFKETVGGSAEQTVIQILEGHGRKIVPAPYNSPFDFIVDGLRVEVKCALVRELRQKRNGAVYSYRGWQLNIHRHNVLNESAVDLYIFCLTQPETCSKVFLLKRAPLGAKTVQFRLNALRKLKYQKALADFYAFAHGRFAERAA